MIRLFLFLFACVPVRLYLAAKLLRLSIIRPLLIAGLFAVAARWVWGTLANSFPDKGFFGGNVFWKRLRLVHALWYALAGALLLWNRPRAAEGVLTLDVAMGVWAKIVLDKSW